MQRAAGLITREDKISLTILKDTPDCHLKTKFDGFRWAKMVSRAQGSGFKRVEVSRFRVLLPWSLSST